MKLRNILIFCLILSVLILFIVIYSLYKEEGEENNIPTTLQNTVEPPLAEFNLDSSENITMIALFFASWGGDYLLPEKREIFFTTSITDQAKQAVIELINGPTLNYLFSPLAKGTALRELYLDPNGTAYVDFSKEFVERHLGGSRYEILTIYSVINTLTINFPSIQRVKILVEGKEIDTLAGHLSLYFPLKPDFSLIGLRGLRRQDETIVQDSPANELNH